MSEPSSLAGAVERGAYWQTRALQAEGQVAALTAERDEAVALLREVYYDLREPNRRRVNALLAAVAPQEDTEPQRDTAPGYLDRLAAQDEAQEVGK